MKPFRYLAPETVADAVARVEPLGAAGEGAAFLAGGTTVLDLMKLHVLAPPSLTDIRKLGLDGIEEDGDAVRVGARVTMAQAALHPVFQSARRFSAMPCGRRPARSFGTSPRSPATFCSARAARISGTM